MFYSKETETHDAFIIYSSYGLQSHVVMNDYGVVFSCNPKLNDDAEKTAKVFVTKEEAKASLDKWYDQIAKVKIITKWEKSFDIIPEDLNQFV